MGFEFNNGDRVRLIDEYPVRAEYRGRVGTVVGDWSDLEMHSNIKVVYDFRPEAETWSEACTLIPIYDDLNTDKIDAFIEDM